MGFYFLVKELLSSYGLIANPSLKSFGSVYVLKFVPVVIGYNVVRGVRELHDLDGPLVNDVDRTGHGEGLSLQNFGD